MFNPSAAQPADAGGRTTSNPLDRRAGSLIRSRRIELGLTQTDLAQLCGVTFQQIQKYERGANRVSYSRLVQIARALQVRPGWFFEGLDGEDQNDGPDAATTLMGSREGRTIVQVLPRLDAAQRRLVADLAANLAGQSPVAA